ncbi:Chorismate synthase [Lachnospiraceae bacterium TWA4]|nr:Chorismate synthase [Lachnospiraceae bacterium TWA4]
MAGSVLGEIFKISTWGESHGKALGVVVDGCPAGIELSEEDIQVYLDRRKPGRNAFTTNRKESDQVEILSGVFEGKTTGTPISLVVFNKDQRSKDYSQIANCYRPGHADYTFDKKYGFRDYRGGGRSSGRETIGRVAAGAIACKVLKELGIEFMAYTKSIGEIEIKTFDKSVIARDPLSMPDTEASKKAQEYLEKIRKEQDSAGGVIECRINHLPVGIGNTVFDKLDANLAKAMFSLGSVKGFEIGDGFNVSSMRGSENNDNFILKDGKIAKETNHSGGILGGMSDGDEVVFRVAIKPTPSISRPQKTVTISGEETTIEIHGRHDPVIAPRAVVVVESMAAITVLDLLLSNMCSSIDKIKKVYSE